MAVQGVEPLTLVSWGQPPYQLSQAFLVTKARFNEINNKTTTKIKPARDSANQSETTNIFKFSNPQRRLVFNLQPSKIKLPNSCF